MNDSNLSKMIILIVSLSVHFPLDASNRFFSVSIFRCFAALTKFFPFQKQMLCGTYEISRFQLIRRRLHIYFAYPVRYHQRSCIVHCARIGDPLRNKQFNIHRNSHRIFLGNIFVWSAWTLIYEILFLLNKLILNLNVSHLHHFWFRTFWSEIFVIGFGKIHH